MPNVSEGWKKPEEYGKHPGSIKLGSFFWCWQLVLLLLDRTSLKSMTLGGYIRDVELNIRRWAAREEPRVCIPTAEPVQPFITPFFWLFLGVVVLYFSLPLELCKGYLIRC